MDTNNAIGCGPREPWRNDLRSGGSGAGREGRPGQEVAGAVARLRCVVDDRPYRDDRERGATAAMERDLGSSRAALSRVVNAYLLTFGGFLLLGGRAGDIFGRRVFMGGLAPCSRPPRCSAGSPIRRPRSSRRGRCRAIIVPGRRSRSSSPPLPSPPTRRGPWAFGGSSPPAARRSACSSTGC